MPNDKDILEEIEQALADVPRFELQHGTKVVKWLRYLLKQHEDSQHLIRHYTEKRDELMASVGKLENTLAKERFEHQHSREDAGRWERKADQLAKDNERLQAQNTLLRGLYERERAIADSVDEKRKEVEKECERLRIALHTHQSYDKTASELHEENERLRGELERIEERADDCLLSGDYKDWMGAESALRYIRSAASYFKHPHAIERGDKPE